MKLVAQLVNLGKKINKAIIDVLQNINLAEMGMKDESQQLLKLTNITEMIS